MFLCGVDIYMYLMGLVYMSFFSLLSLARVLYTCFSIKL